MQYPPFQRVRRILTLAPTRSAMTLLLLLAGTFGGASCTTSDSTKTSSDSDRDGTTLGPAGGTVVGPDGVSVKVPAGALNKSVTVSISEAGSGYPALPVGQALAGAVYAFEPHGQRFAADVQIDELVQAGASGATSTRVVMAGS
jgi:hypothetical protein